MTRTWRNSTRLTQSRHAVTHLATNGSCLAGARSATHHREAVDFKFGDPEPSWIFPWSIH